MPTHKRDQRFKISKVAAREILDSRGNPTIEVDVLTKGGGFGRACVPSGVSVGAFEALELRDGDETRYRGNGVLKAAANVNEIIAPAIIGCDSRDQKLIDLKMIEIDGTDNKSRLGANAVLGVSLAVAKAAAGTAGMPLFAYLGGEKACVMPVPLMNVINGGRHAGNELKLQEFMILPIGADSFREALRMGVEIYHSLKDILKKEYGPSATNVGDEGGFAPPIKFTRQALDILLKAIDAAGFTQGRDVILANDAAASEFYDEKKKKYDIDGKQLSANELIDFYVDLVNDYPIRSIEDPFQEEDFENTAELTKKIGRKVQIVGDDIFATNMKRLKRGIEMGAANALLLKVNQIGTLTEALEAASLSLKSGYKVIVSHRSGETEDQTIADIAVGINSGQIKAGAPARGERTAKYNQLLRIEEYLGGKAVYPGKTLFK
jgi:enolase